MKSLFVKSIFFTFLMLALSSCFDTDEVDKYVSWGVVTDVDGSNYDFKVRLDDGTMLLAETVEVSCDVDTMDRVKVYFNLLSESNTGDSSINVNVFYILIYDIKDLITVENADTVPDSLGTDCMAVYDETVWQSNNLLNVPFRINVSYIGQIDHDVNLVYFQDSVIDSKGTVYLELRHNANDDYDEESVDCFYSFDMESIPPFQNVTDSVPYRIVINPGPFNLGLSQIEGYFYAY